MTMSIEENVRHQDPVTPHRLSVPPLIQESLATAMQKLSSGAATTLVSIFPLSFYCLLQSHVVTFLLKQFLK
jgi:hypothetical protein